MPIRINLLSEALAAEELRRRDPVKRAIFIGGLLVVLSFAWYSSTLLEFKLAQRNKSLVENEIQSQTNKFNQALIEKKKNDESQMRLAALECLSTNRFLQGNLMNALQQIYVPGVQLTRLRVDQFYSVKAGSPAKTSSSGTTPGIPGKATEQIVMTLDAKDASSNPGDQVNHYKEALTKLDFFSSSLNKTNGIRLSSLSAPQNSVSGRPFVMFTLECRFNDVTR
jgi:hypothetical protein